MISIKPGIPALVLAPMEGFVEAPMRALLSERGGFSFSVAEFLRISQEVPPLRVYSDHMPELKIGSKTPSGAPVQLQLLGGDPEKLAESAVRAHQAGAFAIDLNFGCPAPTVNKHDGGATLLKFPDRIREIVSAVRQRLPLQVPVSAKLRLGWDDPAAIYLNAEMAELGGASWITIHGRTRQQGYIPPAYWQPIGEVRKNVKIPVIANGEIWSLDDFKRCRDESGCEHFMLGRGALANPQLPLQIAQELGVPAPFPSPQLWSELFSRFSILSKDFTSRRGYVPSRLKQWARTIHNRTPIPWFDPIKQLQDTEEILKVIMQLENGSH